MLCERIRLEADASEAARFNAWLDGEISNSGLEPAIGADIKLCLNEALANLIDHAFEGTAAPAIFIDLDLRRGLARAIVWDNGTHFDLRGWPAPQKPETLWSHPIGGFGIALIRERASSLDYRSEEGWNRLEIRCGTADPATARQGT